MITHRTLQRTVPGERSDRGWLITREGDDLRIARTVHSEWLTVQIDDLPQFLADLQEMGAAPE